MSQIVPYDTSFKKSLHTCASKIVCLGSMGSKCFKITHFCHCNVSRSIILKGKHCKFSINKKLTNSFRLKTSQKVVNDEYVHCA